MFQRAATIHKTFPTGVSSLEFRNAEMKPDISKTSFGSITIAGQRYEHDVIIRLDGKVMKRKKKLSKKIFGTSHTISLAEAEYIYEKGARSIVIGTGQTGMVELSPEAAAFFESKRCATHLLPTPRALELWNEIKGPAIALFHLTC
jgi:hypothetical protein